MLSNIYISQAPSIYLPTRIILQKSEKRAHPSTGFTTTTQSRSLWKVTTRIGISVGFKCCWGNERMSWDDVDFEMVVTLPILLDGIDGKGVKFLTL